MNNKIQNDIATRRARLVVDKSAKCDVHIRQARATYPTAPRCCGKSAKYALGYSYYCAAHAERDIPEYVEALKN
jgi:hypothetical protein